ncbi:MAG TPA: hypothetical protein VLA34_03070, partial [Candidatus Krumholzibacterium sp.]|nr:hypothetical protein [Candidatus Krumholzibacterium sp.]
MQVLYEVMLPVFFVVALGYLTRRLGRIDERVLSRVQLYILGPALIFMTMSGSDAETSLVLKVLLHVTVLSAMLYVVAQVSGLLSRSDATERNAMSIAAVFTN